MRFEHFAINVPEPVAMARWYIQHLGLTARVAKEEPPYAHFLADSTGRVMVELYHNPAAPVPDYAEQDSLVFHVAFAVSDAEAERDRLLEAGATLDKDETLPDGSRVIMLRDPWSVPVQLCQRAQPFE